MGRGEEARAGLGETGKTGMEEQLRDPNPRWRDSRWPGARCPVPGPAVAKLGSGSCGSAGNDVMATGSQVFVGSLIPTSHSKCAASRAQGVP